MSDTVIALENVSFTYPGGVRGIERISLSIHNGEFILLAGKNGSGKTTLIRHLNGLLRPDSGRVMVNGNPVDHHLTDTRKTVGMVFQDADSQIVGDTVFDEVAFGLENLKLPRAQINEKVFYALEMLGLTDLKERNPWALSGGEKRRLAIAGILVMDPSVIVFDEPFSNLDYPGALTVLSAIVKLNREGHTLIIATHDIETVIYHANRMIIMADGRIRKDGLPCDLLNRLEAYGVREPCSSRLGKGIQPWQS